MFVAPCLSTTISPNDYVQLFRLTNLYLVQDRFEQIPLQFNMMFFFCFTINVRNTVYLVSTSNFFCLSIFQDSYIRQTVRRSCRTESAFSSGTNSRTVTCFTIPARSIAASIPELPPPITATSFPVKQWTVTVRAVCYTFIS